MILYEYCICIIFNLCFGVIAKFNAGRVKPGKFEYSAMNGWMHVNDAVTICESDLACGGFTFKGSYMTKDSEMEIYFFHIIKNDQALNTISQSLYVFLSEFKYLFEKFKYLHELKYSFVNSSVYYYHWSTYTVDRDFIIISNMKVKHTVKNSKEIMR